jgi:hypothetical protein
MLARTSPSTPLTVIAKSLVVAGLLLGGAMPIAAQGPGPDVRWTPWLGCWTPASTLVRAIGKTSTAAVCIVPASGTSAVDVLTVFDGKVRDRTHLEADGQPRKLSKDGCIGWQSATWALSSRRVYLKSEFSCKGAPTARVSAIYAMAGSGEWIDVQGMSVEKNTGVHAVRYRVAVDPGALPDEVSQKLQERTMASEAAVLAVVQPPSLGDVEEAARVVDPAVVSTWLIESDKVAMDKPAPLAAKALLELADAKVPASVIDVMVGLSYPRVLAVNPVNYGQVARQGSDSGFGQGNASAPLPPRSGLGFDSFGYPMYGYDTMMNYGCYSPYDIGFSSLYSPFGCGMDPYSLYGGYGGYGGYGYGYGGYPYPGDYYGGLPVVQPIGQGDSGTPSHGRVVNGHGYTQGSGGSNGTASPRSNNESPPSSESGSMGAGASSPPPARTAVPRKP